MWGILTWNFWRTVDGIIKKCLIHLRPSLNATAPVQLDPRVPSMPVNCEGVPFVQFDSFGCSSDADAAATVESENKKATVLHSTSVKAKKKKAFASYYYFYLTYNVRRKVFSAPDRKLSKDFCRAIKLKRMRKFPHDSYKSSKDWNPNFGFPDPEILFMYSNEWLGYSNSTFVKISGIS